ncbi:Uncharacterised protein [Chlamydia trachomatis]|nr:Uncharacterised protein [Chlamydia trachomatis]
MAPSCRSKREKKWSSSCCEETSSGKKPSGASSEVAIAIISSICLANLSTVASSTNVMIICCTDWRAI